MARTELQGFWRFLHRCSIVGMGYMNTDPARNGEYRFLAEWASQNRLRAGRRPVVFDVGANEGDFTAQVLALLDDVEVHCFEPNPLTFARLSARFGRESRVVLNHCGLGAGVGSGKLYDRLGSSGTGHASFLEEAFIDICPAETTSFLVPLTTLDAYRKEHRLGYIDFLKVDVEGFEQEVFFGMAQSIRESRQGVIQFEMNAHNAITGLSLYRLSRLFPEYDMLKLLPNGWELLVGEGRCYNSRIEIYKYANFILVPQTGSDC